MQPVNIINSIFNDAKGWLTGILLSISVAVIIWQGVQYQKGDDDEKLKAKKNMKRSLELIGGIFILIWLASYAFSKFSVLK